MNLTPRKLDVLRAWLKYWWLHLQTMLSPGSDDNDRILDPWRRSLYVEDYVLEYAVRRSQSKLMNIQRMQEMFDPKSQDAKRRHAHINALSTHLDNLKAQQLFLLKHFLDDEARLEQQLTNKIAFDGYVKQLDELGDIEQRECAATDHN